MVTGPNQPLGTASVERLALALGAADYSEDDKLRLSGIARPDIDNCPLGQAVADLAGQWKFFVCNAVDLSTHQLHVDQVAPDGRRSA